MTARSRFFQDVALLGDTRQLTLPPTDLGRLIILTRTRGGLRELLAPLVKGMLADPRPLRSL
jgi:hypothetical protein